MGFLSLIGGGQVLLLFDSRSLCRKLLIL